MRDAVTDLELCEKLKKLTKSSRLPRKEYNVMNIQHLHKKVLEALPWWIHWARELGEQWNKRSEAFNEMETRALDLEQKLNDVQLQVQELKRNIVELCQEELILEKKISKTETEAKAYREALETLARYKS
jgi:peptidoglycan hydrolase CwlO-like protein